VAQDLGLSYRVLDRCGLAHSFVEYPQAMRFFSPPDEMEVGGVPFPMRGGEKPSREDILPYFRAVAAYRKLTMSLWERIVSIQKVDGVFTVAAVAEHEQQRSKLYRARTIALASGVWDVPNHLDCEGANLPHVHYRFHEPTEYFGCPVLVVGGGNSAIHAALALSEAHASVILAMRREPVAYQSHLRPFVVRDLQFAVDAGHVLLHAGVRVLRIEPGTAWLEPIRYDIDTAGAGEPIGDPYPADARFVFALIGQHSDALLFRELGLTVEPDGRPVRDPDTYETETSGVYVIGSLAGQKIDIIISGREQAAGVINRIAAVIKAYGS
jgi:thioredoxin reductase (NADPH)